MSSTSQNALNKSCRSYRRIQNPISERRILPCKVSQRCTPHLGINLSRLQCFDHAQRFQKAKHHREVEDVDSQSGSETFLPNAKKLTNFQLPRENPFTIVIFILSLNYVSSQAPNQFCHLRFRHASTTTLHKLPYIISSPDSTRCVICIRSKQTRKPSFQMQAKFPANANE